LWCNSKGGNKAPTLINTLNFNTIKFFLHHTSKTLYISIFLKVQNHMLRFWQFGFYIFWCLSITSVYIPWAFLFWWLWFFLLVVSFLNWYIFECHIFSQSSCLFQLMIIIDILELLTRKVTLCNFLQNFEIFQLLDNMG